MSSVTNRLMKFLPLWIEKFLPMNSGTIVQARAHVLIGSRLPDCSARYTFSSSRSTTYGPFFSERPMGQRSLGRRQETGDRIQEKASSTFDAETAGADDRPPFLFCILSPVSIPTSGFQL